MDSESTMTSLDTEFDQYLVDMKPYVIRLPHKSDRQRCALWIKKLCEPQSGITGRKNRNQYCQLLSLMLKNSQLDSPFTQKPESGPLPTLPSYMSVYFDDLHIGGDEKENRVPDWVAGELPTNTTGVSGLSGISGLSSINATTTSPEVSHNYLQAGTAKSAHSFEEARDRFNEAVGRSPRSDQHYGYKESLFGRENIHRSESPPPLLSREERVPPLHLEDFGPLYPKSGGLYQEDEESTSNGNYDFNYTKPKSKYSNKGYRDEFRNPVYSTSILKDSRNDTTNILNERDLEQKAKMMEARFQEEKLRLQQKHDGNVQKILERKNTELEDLKLHYKNKTKEQEDMIHKLEKKVQLCQVELAKTQELKDRQIEELSRKTEEYNHSRQTDLDKKLQDTISNFDQEKFELQKQHTKNIQDLLDDTNTRLQKMENEYSQQMESTTSVIQELENRIHQLSQDAENLNKIKIQLESEKAVLQERYEKTNSELIDYKARAGASEKELSRLREENDKEMRSLRNKHEANVEFLKQEHQLHSAKNTDTVNDLEGQISQLRQAMERVEQDHNRQVREIEEQHYQDKIHNDHLHEKKIKHLQQELEQLEEASQKKLRKLEDCVREKENDIMTLRTVHDQKASESERALETFKLEMERNSNLMYDELKKQMERVESDLNRSKQLREKQAKEFQKQLQEEKYKHEKQITQLQLAFEQEKSRILMETHDEKEALKSEKEAVMDSLKSSLLRDMNEIECKARERQERDANTISELDSVVQKLREEVVGANQLRKQQLMELGILREEEKQKMLREHEQEISSLQYSFEQQRLEMEKKHAAEIETTLEKANSRLKHIESDYSTRLQKSNEATKELETQVEKLKMDLERNQHEAQADSSQKSHKLEEERRKWKQNHSNLVTTHQQDVENLKTKLRRAERKCVELEQDHDEKITQVRTQYEEKIKGMIASSVRQELEETISSLKSQTKSLQMRCALLQDQLDYPTVDSNRLSVLSTPSHLNYSKNTSSSVSSVKSATGMTA